MVINPSEQKISTFIFEHLGQKTGVILDVGAGDGFYLSNSFYFINQGWIGYLIKPGAFIFLHDFFENKYYKVKHFLQKRLNMSVHRCIPEHIPNFNLYLGRAKI